MYSHSNHPYHLVDYSPWPLMASIGIMTSVSGLVKWFHYYEMNLFLLGNLILLITIFQWWRDVIRESTFQGMHTQIVINSLKYGMILFIISEIMFFISFFWAFFHSSLAPSIETGLIWPPKGIIPFNPMQIPLLNTMILLSSGITITWAHHSIMNNNYTQMTQGLSFTILLGIYFSMLQMYEYIESKFTIADSIYGSTFFMTTGFHGIHVLIGTSFLLICLIRHMNFHFSKNHHFGFEAAAWYWHFVDVIWLFLFISIYWWGK
uniref:Cytochrome c oxidase subunit 3 n=1 Tax=Melophagus ovinus TaxID=452749 RepID=A0A343WAT6_9MUSC|nr:cytochrome c oxidase subunit III [Melophagus ovinus]ART65747.1 cytochrome c oxidase subunit III [Melophagus ovinus]AWB97140.1 cytochrome c oxidase subunit III [Melophagus ovinus]